MKAIVEIDIPSDYIDDYKKWLLDGSLYYLEDGDWTHLKNIECELKPTNKAVPVEWIVKWAWAFMDKNSEGYKMAMELLHDWEKENEHKESD